MAWAEDRTRTNGGGQGALGFVQHRGRTVVHTARATSPLRLLTPQNHGHGAWAYLASLGGGLVDGDAIELDVDVGPAACAVLGTQASTKVYRCPTGTCRQETRARVAAEGLLVMIPDPVACFAGARYAQSIAVELAPGASLILVDAFTSGRSARGERWDFHRYASRIAVTREGTPALLDSIVLDPAHGELRARLGRFEALATVILVGPRAAPLAERALARASGDPTPPPPQGGARNGADRNGADGRVKSSQGSLARAAALVRSASPLPAGDGAVVRVAGAPVEAVVAAVRETLGDLGALLGDDPFARKW